MKSAIVRSSLFLVYVVFAALFTPGKTFPSGAPQSACEEGRPSHLNGSAGDTDRMAIEPQTGENPYSFTVEVDAYRPGGDLQVTIEGADGATFQGFLLQARRTSDNVTVGTFTAPASSIGQLLTCTNEGDTVIHSNSDSKTAQTFTWHAADVGTGDVQFFGTVAENHDVFFEGTSETLSEGEAFTGEPTTAGMTTAGAVKMSSGYAVLLLAAIISTLQMFA